MVDASSGPSFSKRRQAKREAKKARAYLEEGSRFYRLGRSNFHTQALLKAKELLAAAVALQPTPAGFFYLGGTLNLLSRPNTAARAYRECIRLDPLSAAAHQNLAQVYDDLGNRTAAHVHYKQWAQLEPSAQAKKGLALSYLWEHTHHLQEGSRLCDEASELDPRDPSIPFDCAQLLVLLLPPGDEDVDGRIGSEACGPGPEEICSDASSSHWMTHIEPKFRRAQEATFASWTGGPRPLAHHQDGAEWAKGTGALCPNGGEAIRDPGLMAGAEDPVLLSLGGVVYGQRMPHTFGGGFSWAGQRYVERSVRMSKLTDVMVSGNEGVITKGCQIFVPYYDKQVPWHENLPSPAIPAEPVRWLPVALWLLVMFPANFFSFLVDELARLAVWLTVSRQRIPLLVPADRGQLKPFMYDWLALLGGFDLIPYDVRPHFMGAARVAEPRFFVRQLHVVDWQDAPGSARREDVFLLPPRWALQRLRDLVVGRAFGFAKADAKHGGGKTLLWIQRAVATTRRVANEAELLGAMMTLVGHGWELQIFSDSPMPSARRALELFRSADIVVGVHGSGQANVVFCRPGTGIIDINLPEPHSQYTAHNSYALGFRYRLVMLQGVGLHQSLNITLPVGDVLDALRTA